MKVLVDKPELGPLGDRVPAKDPQQVALETATKAEGDDGGRKRLTINARRVFGAGLLCFAIWLLLDAPTLMKNAEASDFGVRRTVAMDVLRPIAWVSRSTGLDHIVGAMNTILNRNGSSAVALQSGPGTGSGPAGHRKITPATVPRDTVVTSPTGSTVVTQPVLADGWPAFPPISAKSPLRVLIVGDSVGTDLGQYALVNDLGRTGVVQATLDGHISTGLTRPDYFNWPAELQNDLNSLHPQLTIICIGANDPQNDYANGQLYDYGTAAWNQMYAQRVSSFISEATNAGSRVLWVGMPPMASGQLNNQMENLNSIYATQAAAHPGARYLSSDQALGGPSGQYEAFKDLNGSPESIRTDDGIHLQPAGAELLSEAVITDMDSVYKLDLKP
ncbi:MAG: DUF459 domain-containing protein [Acidimicrobiales bacterium]